MGDKLGPVLSSRPGRLHRREGELRGSPPGVQVGSTLGTSQQPAHFHLLESCSLQDSSPKLAFSKAALVPVRSLHSSGTPKYPVCVCVSSSHLETLPPFPPRWLSPSLHSTPLPLHLGQSENGRRRGRRGGVMWPSPGEPHGAAGLLMPSPALPGTSHFPARPVLTAPQTAPSPISSWGS